MKIDGTDPLQLNRIIDQARRVNVQEVQRPHADIKVRQREKVLGKEVQLPEDRTFQEELQDAVKKMNDTARAFDLSLRFHLHEESERWMVQVVDVSENEVIKEIPPEEILNLVAQIQNLIGILLDERR